MIPPIQLYTAFTIPTFIVWTTPLFVLLLLLNIIHIKAICLDIFVFLCEFIEQI